VQAFLRINKLSVPVNYISILPQKLVILKQIIVNWGTMSMIQHFQFKPLFSNRNIPGWSFSFYYKKKRYTGIYHQTGQIEWVKDSLETEERETLTKQIHEIMLYHVYEQ